MTIVVLANKRSNSKFSNILVASFNEGNEVWERKSVRQYIPDPLPKSGNLRFKKRVVALENEQMTKQCNSAICIAFVCNVHIMLIDCSDIIQSCSVNISIYTYSHETQQLCIISSDI